MSLKISLARLYYSSLIVFLLMFQSATSQQNFPEIDRALKMNQQALGKDAVMLIYKSGKLVYENALGDLTSNSQQRIASCSKWLTAALVMSFVDEGKLSLEMANLDQVPATGALIVVTWPKVKNGLGFPARAFAILP